LYGLYIIGTAGSGKSLLASSLIHWFRMKEQDAAVINLDPGVITLPYTPDIDIRDRINIVELMDKYQLGPNGALIMAADLIAGQVDKLNEEIAELNAEYFIFDTPGQMELFAFRVSGPFIANELKIEQKLVLYLFDAPFSSNPLNYVSNMFLSAAVYNRFLLPQLNILSKMDLLPKNKLREILNWSSQPEALEASVQQKLSGSTYLLTRDLFNAISRLRLDFSLIACSAKNMDNFVNLHAAIQRVFRGGEEV
jgi:GTPase SAR1 family protein